MKADTALTALAVALGLALIIGDCEGDLRARSILSPKDHYT
jgi:hypothetical protein